MYYRNFKEKLNSSIDDFNNESIFFKLDYKIIDLSKEILSFEDIILEIFLKENNSKFNIDKEYKKLDDEKFFFDFLKLTHKFSEYFILRKESDESSILENLDKNTKKSQVQQNDYSAPKKSLKEIADSILSNEINKRDNFEEKNISDQDYENQKQHSILGEYFNTLDEKSEKVYLVRFLEKIENSKYYKNGFDKLAEEFNKNKKYLIFQKNKDGNYDLIFKEDFYLDMKYRNNFKTENKILLNIKLNHLTGKKDDLNSILFSPDSLFSDLHLTKDYVIRLYAEFFSLLWSFDLEKKESVFNSKYLDFFFGINSIQKTLNGLADFYVNDLQEIELNISSILQKLNNRLDSKF